MDETTNVCVKVSEFNDGDCPKVDESNSNITKSINADPVTNINGFSGGSARHSFGSRINDRNVFYDDMLSRNKYDIVGSTQGDSRPMVSSDFTECSTVHKCQCKMCGNYFRNRSKSGKVGLSLNGTSFIESRETCINGFTQDNFFCHKCLEKFPNKDTLIKHITVCEGRLPFQCEICSEFFTGYSVFAEHLYTHAGELVFGCHKCSEVFYSNCDLISHLEVHVNGQYKCSICEKKFSDYTMLKQHVGSHVEDIMLCEVCQKTFKDKNELIKHTEDCKTSFKNLFECEFCSEKFKVRSSFIKHLKNHRKKKLYVCEICKKRFRKHNQLTLHNKIHTRKKQFRCDTCKTDFSDTNALMEHTKSHEENLASELAICSKRFTNKSDLMNRSKIYKLKIHNFKKEPEQMLRGSGLVETLLKSNLRLTFKSTKLAQSASLKKIQRKKVQEKQKIYCDSDKTFRPKLQQKVQRSSLQYDKETSNLSLRPKIGSQYNITKSRTQKKFQRSKKIQTVVKEEEFQCYLCLKDLPNSTALKRHLKIHSDHKPFECDICGKGFREKGRLNEHIKIHSSEAVYQCEHCDKKFKSNRTLADHLHTHTGERPYSCTTCKKSFSLRTTLVQHIRTHAVDQRCYTCETCGELFKDRKAQKTHALSHFSDGELIYQCEKCGRKFSSKYDLSRHFQAHDRVIIHRCRECNKEFQTKTKLMEHTMLHTGRLPFTCDKESSCRKQFSLYKDLCQHIRNAHYRSERKHQCEQCGKRYGDNATLQRHIKTHSEDRPFECEVCGKNYKEKGALTQHVFASHSGVKPYQCSTCGKSFVDNSMLQMHFASHNVIKPFACDVCGKCFRSQNYLYKHSRIHSEDKPYGCDICAKKFHKHPDLTAHKRSHTGERPFKCNSCGKSFGHSSNLHRHKLKFHPETMKSSNTDSSDIKNITANQMPDVHSNGGINDAMDMHNINNTVQNLCVNNVGDLRSSALVVSELHNTSHVIVPEMHCVASEMRSEGGESVDSDMRVNVPDLHSSSSQMCLSHSFVPDWRIYYQKLNEQQ